MDKSADNRANAKLKLMLTMRVLLAMKYLDDEAQNLSLCFRCEFCLLRSISLMKRQLLGGYQYDSTFDIWRYA